jgi:hypothetical protein
VTRGTCSGAITTPTSAITVTGAFVVALTVARVFAVQPPTERLVLELQDYAALPITADNTNDNTRAQLARINYLARAVAFAISQSEDVDINEILFRPTRQEL